MRLKTKRKQVSLLLIIVMVLSTVLNFGNPVQTYANEKKEIANLQFAGAAAGKILQYPASVPYENTAVGFTFDTNAVYKVNTNTTPSLLATGWDTTVGKYWQFGFHPKNYENYSISFYPRSSNTGPKDFKLQYSTDGQNWIDVAGSAYIVSNSYSEKKEFNLPAELSDLEQLSIRMVTTSLTSVNNGTVASGGVSNINSILLSGTSIEGSNPGIVQPVASNHPTDTLVPETEPIVLSSPSVVTGGAVAVSGSAIYYSVNDGGYQAYTGPFTLADHGACSTHTDFNIKAYAQVEGVKSTESLFHYYTKEAGSGGSGVDTGIVLPVASFAGTGQITSPTVYGDKNAPNDYLDTSVWLTHSSGAIPSPTSNQTCLGSKGSTAGSYYQIELNTKLYGNIQLSYAMKGSGTGPKNFNIFYSTDGSNFTRVNAAPLSITAASALQNFNMTLPAAAGNLSHLYIRVQVADSVSINNGSIGSAGTNYFSDIKITGSPVIADNIVGYPKITPKAGRVRQGEEITITSDTPGAAIYYSYNGSDPAVYDSSKKPVFTSFPAVITAYGVKSGYLDSLPITYSYTQSQVDTVNASPNGGARLKGTKVTLSCGTEGASIQYSYDGGLNWKNYNQAEKITLDNFPVNITAKAVLGGYKDSETSEFKFTERVNENYNIYFGQLHSHTDYSDGAGNCDQAFTYAKNTAKQIDFLAVTDHSNSFDNADKASLADGSVSEEWKEGHNLADKYTDSSFVGIYGFEMTWSNGLGHINTFNTPGFQSRTQSNYTAYSTALSNYYTTLKTQTGSISQFNHPGTTFGDFSDFDHYDKEIDQLITLIEVGNGEGAIGSSGYFPSYEYYTRALDKGWHVAPSNNQDNHKGYWGDANTARTVILADSLTRDNIYDAIRNRRTYATEDNDLEIQYTLNNEIMGTILDTPQKTADIKVKLKDPTDSAIGKVEVIVNGGLSIDNKIVSANEAELEFHLPATYSYYYIRVTEPDKNIAVTAPVWIGDVDAAGISKVSTTAVLPVKGEPVDINTELYNNEDKALEIESIEYSIGNKVIHSVDLKTSNLTKLEPFTKTGYRFNYTYPDVGAVTVHVTMKAALNGTAKVYQGVLKLSYVDPSMVTKVVVDGTHYNDYVTGYYGNNIGNLTQIAAGENIKVTVVKDKITEDILSDCDLLIISAPAKKKDTANAGPYSPSHFEEDFMNLVKSYTKKGGTVIICGLADYQDTAEGQSSTELNKLLQTIGATTRINSDEAVDDDTNGGQKYRLYLKDYNTASPYTRGIVADQVYSAYSGCTLLLDQEAVKTGKAEYLVKGHPTTYSIDSKIFGGNYTQINKGDAVMLAREQLNKGSNVFIASTVFMSDYEVKAEMDNIWDVPYMNKTILVNILDSIRKEIAVTPIASVRNGVKGEIYCVEGTVTAGTLTGNAFFDTIYLQDSTGGINIFPINEGVIEPGQKVKVTGYLDEYLGDTELRVITAEVTDKNKNPVSPALVTTKEAMDYAANGGRFVQVKGKVTDVILKNGVVETIWIKDASGIDARVFLDGYIKYSDRNSKALESIAIKGNEISAIGLVSCDTEGVRLRVRDRSEIVLQKAAENESGNGNSSTTGKANVAKTVETDKENNALITTTITKSTDESGNPVTVTEKVTTDIITGKTIKTVTETLTQDIRTGSSVTAVLTKDRNGNMTKADAVADLRTPKITRNSNKSTITLGVLRGALEKAAKETTEKVPLSVTVQLPAGDIAGQLEDKEITAIKVVVSLPDGAAHNSRIHIHTMKLPKEMIQLAKEKKKDLSLIVKDENGKEIYSVSLFGSTLSKSRRKVTDVNTALSILPVQTDQMVSDLLGSYMKKTSIDQGLLLQFNHNGDLPGTAQVRIYIGRT